MKFLKNKKAQESGVGFNFKMVVTIGIIFLILLLGLILIIKFNPGQFIE